MTIEIRVCTTVPVAPAELWNVLEHIETHTDWMTDAETITFVTESTRGVGTAFVCVTRVGPIRLDDRMTVTRWEPGIAMGIAHEGVVAGRGEFHLAPSASDETRFCWTETLQFPWWLGGWFGERAGRLVLTRIWRANLRRLRTYAVRTARDRRGPGSKSEDR